MCCKVEVGTWMIPKKNASSPRIGAILGTCICFRSSESYTFFFGAQIQTYIVSHYALDFLFFQKLTRTIEHKKQLPGQVSLFFHVYVVNMAKI